MNKYLEAFRNMPGSSSSARSIFGREYAQEADRLFSKDRNFLLGAYGVRLIPPDISTVENMFFISPAELDEIMVAATQAGRKGKAITDLAREYVRNIV
jgi:hypothetical protein